PLAAPSQQNNDDEEKPHTSVRPDPSAISIPTPLLTQWNRTRGGPFPAGNDGVHRRNEPVPPACQRLNVEGMVCGVVQCRSQPFDCRVKTVFEIDEHIRGPELCL